MHTAQNVKLAQLGALRIDYRIIGGGGFRQPCEHGCFRNSDLAKRLAKVNLSSRGKAVSTLAKINLVDIKLQNFVFAQAVFDFEGSSTSLNLRVMVFSLVRKKLRATCMVIVLAPCFAVPEVKLENAARMTPM